MAIHQLHPRSICASTRFTDEWLESSCNDPLCFFPWANFKVIRSYNKIKRSSFIPGDQKVFCNDRISFARSMNKSEIMRTTIIWKESTGRPFISLATSEIYPAFSQIMLVTRANLSIQRFVTGYTWKLRDIYRTKPSHGSDKTVRFVMKLKLCQL
jgi:hypothetical protein